MKPERTIQGLVKPKFPMNQFFWSNKLQAKWEIVGMSFENGEYIYICLDPEKIKVENHEGATISESVFTEKINSKQIVIIN